jgi:prevent-host-death family protein
MQQVGASRARVRFGRLLDRVAASEAVVITRRGEPVARMLPPGQPCPPFDPERARRAVVQIRALRKGATLGPGPSVRDLGDDGRR